MGSLTASLRRLGRRGSSGIVALAVVATVASLSARSTLARAPEPLHASLRSSEPAAGAVLRRSPIRIRLVFSEPIEASMSGLTFLASPRDVRPLVATADPHDVHALVAWPGVLPPGRYAMGWHAVSADGHRVNGRLDFTVLPDKGQPPAGVSSSVGRDSALAATTASDTLAKSRFAADSRADRLTRMLRGAAVTALLALAGLALLIAMLPLSGPRPMRVGTWLGVTATLLLAGYMVAWSISVAGDGVAGVDAVMTATATTPGALEVARVALAMLALWALGLARRPGLAAAFAGIATLITGASGHPATLSPAWTIPAKAIHLGAAALWLGGLIWLVTADRHGGRYVEGARRISSLALGAVLAVVATGILQGALFLPSVGSLFQSTYGRVLLLKSAGFVVLVFFGAYHRRIVPRMETTVARRQLRRSVRAEIAVMVVVSILGGLLATIAPPHR
ncbi:MAG TPA: copper resistance protein CopC [Gemmatimonadaceae bacterium]|nr:copper resistance protein CopC [Gemmatimonadaceae bacterium]